MWARRLCAWREGLTNAPSKCPPPAGAPPAGLSRVPLEPPAYPPCSPSRPEGCWRSRGSAWPRCKRRVGVQRPARWASSVALKRCFLKRWRKTLKQRGPPGRPAHSPELLLLPVADPLWGSRLWPSTEPGHIVGRPAKTSLGTFLPEIAAAASGRSAPSAGIACPPLEPQTVWKWNESAGNPGQLGHASSSPGRRPSSARRQQGRGKPKRPDHRSMKPLLTPSFSARSTATENWVERPHAPGLADRPCGWPGSPCANCLSSAGRADE